MEAVMTSFKTPRQLAHMREAGLMVFSLFRDLADWLKPGMQGLEIDRYCRAWCRQKGLEPILPGYGGFDGAVCINPQGVAAHGLPSVHTVKPSSVLTVDIAVEYRGLCVDAAWTYLIAPATPELRRLVDGAWKTSARACLEVFSTRSLTRMGETILKDASAHGLTLLSRFCGHGIGRQMHEEPRFDHRGLMEGVDFARPGLAISVEPVLSLGADGVKEDADGTWHTLDGKPCAQFEHNIAPNGPHGPGLLLTLPGEQVLRLASPPF